MPMEVLLATTNPNKVLEFKNLLARNEKQASSLAETMFVFRDANQLGVQLPDVDETGESLQENARLKASASAKATGCWSLADDTGLEVDALGGRPGVHSARYAGSPGNMPANREKLLRELEGITFAERRAKFVCWLAVAAPDGRIVQEASGECDGLILASAQGTSGFGYDSLFWIPEAKQTLAELPADKHAAYSHRARAMQRLVAAWDPSLR
jgi:XTP/dITP diphosphohydrolase